MSNYPHYAPMGASLPNDYAIVEHFASSNQDESALESETEDNLGEADPTSSPGGSPRVVVRHLASREFGGRRGSNSGYGSTSPNRGRRLSVPHHHHGGPRRL